MAAPNIDAAQALTLAQQEMEYRVALFNKCVSNKGNGGIVCPAWPIRMMLSRVPDAHGCIPFVVLCRMTSSCFDKCADKKCVGIINWMTCEWSRVNMRVLEARCLASL